MKDTGTDDTPLEIKEQGGEIIIQEKTPIVTDSFTIETRKGIGGLHWYSYIPGMTWQDWLSSEYNTDGWIWNTQVSGITNPNYIAEAICPKSCKATLSGILGVETVPADYSYCDDYGCVCYVGEPGPEPPVP